MKNQAFKAIIKLFLGLFLIGCAGDDNEVAKPTAIGETAVSPISTPTINSGSATLPEAAATPTLVTEAGSIAEPIPTDVPTEDPTAKSPSANSIGDPYAPELGNTGYDVQHYTIEMALDPAVTHVAATVTMDAIATEADLSQIWLDFVGFDIVGLQVDGVVVPFERVEDKLLLRLSQPLNLNESFRTVIEYEGAPVKEPSPYIGFAASLGMTFVNGESIYVLSEPDGARYWFPNNDHPRDKATYRFEITVPEGLTAVANGTLIENQNNTFIWEHNSPMASYLAIVAVAEYERIEDEAANGITIQHYAFAEDIENFEQATEITAEVIEWMGELFGEYPFDTIGFVMAEAPGASLETQTMILLSSQMVGQRTVVHELAHMWFGDWVSLDSWTEMWRNEGFATYVTMMWEHRDDSEGLELEIAAIETAVSENTPQYPLGSPPPASLFGYNTYFKGALMAHDLRQTVGDEAFFTGLRAYFETYGGGTATDAQFQAEMEAASGLSLDDFFTEWLE